MSVIVTDIKNNIHYDLVDIEKSSCDSCHEAVTDFPPALEYHLRYDNPEYLAEQDRLAKISLNMKIIAEFSTDSDSFQAGYYWDEVQHILGQLRDKVYSQLTRQAATVCDAPESADKLIDLNGNTIGYLKVTI